VKQIALGLTVLAMALSYASRAEAGLVGLYQFGNPLSLGLDSSRLHNNLQAYGGVSYDSTGVHGGALSLDGSGRLSTSSGNVPTAYPIGSSSYTLAVWMCTELGDAGTRQGILGWGTFWWSSQTNAFRLNDGGTYDGGSGFVNYWFGNDLGYNGTNLFDNQWHFLAATYDNSTRTRTLYLDGERVALDSPGLPNVQPTNFSIGTAGPNSFRGQLDDVAIFDEALTGSQLTAIMGGDFSRFGVYAVPEPSTLPMLSLVGGLGLVGWWRKKRTA
jgi:hypothetical protein